MEIDDINKKLFTKLFSNLLPNHDRKLTDKYISYFTRLLNSRLNITTNNEANIISLMIEKISRIHINQNSNIIEKSERFQTLYSALGTKKTLKRRWAVMYLLYRMSSDNEDNKAQDTSKFLQSIFKEEMNINMYQNANSNALFGGIANKNEFYGYEKYEHDKEANSRDIEADNINRHEMKMKNKRSSQIIVNTSKSNKVIKERDLINDLIFIFQGIDGHYLNYNSISNSYTLNQLIPFNDNIYEICAVLSELGWLYRKVNNHLTFFNESSIPSQFVQSFSFAIQSELNEYYKLISLFKKMNSKIEEINHVNNVNNDNMMASNADDVNELSLKKLVLWTMEPIERMKWLAIACESVYPLRGVPIISQLYAFINNCGAEKFLSKVLDETSKPLFVMIKGWLTYGELQDPFHEFFVEINERTSDDDIWASRYILVIKNIPNFFSKSFAEKIFEIGKCINFIRKFCMDSTYSLMKLKNKLVKYVERLEKEIDLEIDKNNKMEIDYADNLEISRLKKSNFKSQSLKEKEKNSQLDMNNKPTYNISEYQRAINLINDLEDESKLNLNLLCTLNSEIDIIHMEINKELVSIVFDKFKFRDHLNAMNRYLLLGQGDMMQYLMDLLFNELKKPATQIYKHNLLNILETAIRASNAQFHEAECLKRLNIKLMDSSTGDTGWDIFVLEYNVDIPLNVIFTKPLLKEYQKLFFFFWKIKRLEFSQEHQTWRNFMTYSHSLKDRFDHLRPYIQKSMLFNRQIIHFVSNLHNYITLEVLETEYKKIIEKIYSANKLDDLIDLHKKFVESVIEQSLLNSEYSLIYKKILQIFDLIFRFKAAQEVLITTVFEDYYKKMDNKYREYDNSLDHTDRDKFFKEAYNQISILYEEFKNEITELINSLDLFGKGNLKYLAMKLDYNYYYSQREVENFHKKERESNYYDKNADEVDEEDGEQYAEDEDEDVGHDNQDDEINNDDINNENESIGFENENNVNPYLNPRKNNKIELLNKRQVEANEEERINIGSNSNDYDDYKQTESVIDETIERSYNDNVSETRRVNINDFIYDKSNLDKNYPSDDNNSFANYSYMKNKKK